MFTNAPATNLAGVSLLFGDIVVQKRTVFKFALAGAASLMLSACGKEEAKTAAPAASAPASGAVAAKADGPLKVAFIYISPVSEEGWSSQHDFARRALEKHFGDKISVTAIDNIPDTADAERVLRDLCNQGNKLIFATSFGYMNGVQKVAREFPDVKFEHCTGYQTAPNVGVYMGRFYEGRYLAGRLAGAMTKSNVLGYVAAFPIPEVVRGINAFTLGARSVNPNAQVRVVWTSSWYDPGKESDAAKSLTGLGADILTHHTDSSAVALAAEKLGVQVISYNSPMTKAAPTKLLAASVPEWTAFYIDRVNKVLDGSWKSESTWNGVADKMVDLVAVNDAVPQNVKDDVAAYRTKLANREFHPFTGPIKSNEGKEMIPAGKTATDKELLEMNWLVEGVVGKLPQN